MVSGRRQTEALAKVNESFNLLDFGFEEERGNYDDVRQEAINHFIKPLYPIFNKEYYVVFAPLDRGYVPDWFKANSLNKLKDWARQKFKATAMVLTREYRGCAKVHINLLCTTSEDLTTFHQKIILNRWKLYVKLVDNDPTKVIDYIYKDAKLYTFNVDKDYMLYKTDKILQVPYTRSLQLIETQKFDYQSVDF